MRKLIVLFFVFPILLQAESYWQQDVHYIIDAKLDPSTAVVTGKETLIYTNNSPDTLKEVYFRLYWNAFTNGSKGQIFHQKLKNYGWTTDGGITLSKFTVINAGKEVEPVITIDNTVMKVELPYALAPGDTMRFYTEWEGKVLTGGNRTGHVGRDFDIAQWYPQISVYDRYGWDKYQYLTQAEFHNEYGTFDVNITVPKSFTVGHCGWLLNPEEVLPDSVRKKLAESMGNDSTVNIADNSKTEWKDADTVLQTWKMRAEHVTDFAWSANEHYIWDVAHWTPPGTDKPITIHALYLEGKRKYWKDVAHFGRHAISFFSTHYGQFLYPNMFVIEGVEGGGMEYPGLTFCGHIGDPNSHSLYGVVVHEIGHNWYPMMMQSNETYFAFMDEGFNTFITTTAVEDYYGRYNNSYTWTDPVPKFFHYDNYDDRMGNQRASLDLAKTGYEEAIATHCYMFKQQSLFGSSIYAKTGSILFMLQYVLGDSVFAHVMMEYYRKYHLHHVYPEDFYNNAMEASGQRDLRWFFTEWFDRTYTCDYGVCGLNSDKITDNGRTVYRTKFSVHRYQQAIMPVDVQLTMDDGSKQTVWFPIDQWINGEDQRDTVIDLPARASKAELNPDGRILDINRLNNITGMNTAKVEFDNTMYSAAPIDSYFIMWRPSIWYTDEGGWQPGVKFNGSYLGDMNKANIGTWYNVREKTLNYDLGIGQNTFMLTPLSNVTTRYYRLEGRKGFDIEGSKGLRDLYFTTPFHTFKIRYSYSKADNNDYLLMPSTWSEGNLQRMIFGYNYYNRGESWTLNGTFNFESSLGLFGQSDYVYSKRTAEVKSTISGLPGFDLALRAFDGLGYGNLPPQVQYYFSGASPIDEMNAPFFSSKGALPSTIRDHALYPGGGNMRGYYGFFASGSKMEAVNAELRFSSTIPFIDNPLPLFSSIPLIGSVFNKITSTLFADAGRVASDPLSLWDQRFEMDCGFGLRLTRLNSFLGPLSGTNLLNGIGLNMIRFDFPIYVSMPPPGEDKLKFRWIVGLNETF